MSIKKTFGQIHLWLGMITGIILFIVCLTGAIWAFSPEIEEFTEPYRHVKAEQKPFLSPMQLHRIAQSKLKKYPVKRINFSGIKKAVTADFWGEDIRMTIFMNPYSGEILKIKNEKESFFYWVIVGHYTLWLGDIGGEIVKWATLLFIVLLITGIILWWPKNKAAAKQRFWFNWKSTLKWKRKNYDLHNILGFYASWLVIFAALTGVLWTFSSFNNALQWSLNGGETIKETEILSQTNITKNTSTSKLDSLVKSVWENQKKSYHAMEISFPESDSAAIGISLYPEKQTWHNGDYLYFDQYTYREIPVKSWGKYHQASTGEKLNRQYYNIHVGNILGFTGRIMMFIATLIAASLPITGFYIWWGKRKKVIKKTPNN